MQGSLMNKRIGMAMAAICLAAGVSNIAMAQGSERGEIQQRYDAALAATLDPATIGANDARYTWASEAKVQCAIALGYFKSGTRDETSIARCNDAYERMAGQASPEPLPPPPPPPTETCSRELPGIIYFDWNSSELPAEASETAQFVAANAAPCGWTSITVTGHADRSGSNAYNMGLSARRADAVANLIASYGVPRETITTAQRGEEEPRVLTADGVREPQNRRVEIGVR
ncbi:OmpA family protein [Sphingopyxis flava]|uniref:OmpA family protein n=2 Tax=Sphingopyxis flava TaxID=1507287 RepID=A0A1T5FIX8_9SPHN|nr:OmpA family protein [Sphingopyxis flava]